MKLVEKKCPNCGGDLKFGINDKETKCEYCNKAYEIERENDDKEELFNADNYKFIEEGAEAAKAVVVGFAAAQMIPIFIFAIFFIMIVVFGIFFGFRQTGSNRVNDKEKVVQKVEESDREKLKKENYVLELKNLEEKDLTEIHNSTTSTLNTTIKRHETFTYSHGSYSYVGMYFILSPTGNTLYDVYKITFNIDGTDKEYYSAVKYGNIKKIDGKLVANLDGFEINPYATSGRKSVLGYESCQELFNKNIRGRLENSTLEVSGDVYND
jgi:hypothetical protein